MDRLHQTKKRGLVPCSLYLTLITSKVMFRICPAFKSSRLKTIGNCHLLSFNCRPTVHLLNKRKDGHQQLMQLRKEGLKKYRLAGIRTQTSAIPVQHSNQLCYRANWSLNCWPFVGRPSPRCRRSGLLARSWSTVDVGVIGTSRYCANL